MDVARRQRLPGAELLDVGSQAEIDDVWEKVADGCRISEEELALAVADDLNMDLVDLSSAEPHAQKLVPDNPIELTRWQVANCYMGRAGLINSGGASGKNDLQQAAKTAVINKRAGGMGMISGRKAFQRPMAEGVKLLNAIQDVFLDDGVTIA